MKLKYAGLKVIFFISFSLTIFSQYIYQQLMVDSTESSLIKDVNKEPLIKTAFPNNNIQSNLFAYSLNNASLTEKTTNSHYYLSIPAYANHSNKIAFLSNESNTTQIWLRAENGNISVISDSPISLEPTRLMWSPNDQKILFLHQNEIFSLNVSTGKLIRLVDINHQPNTASWSKSGKSVLYTSAKLGEMQIWQFDLDTKIHLQLTQNGAFTVRQSTQGSIFMTREEKMGLWELKRDNESERGFAKEAKLKANIKIHQNYWQLSGDHIYYIAKTGKALSLFEYYFRDNSKRLILVLNKEMLPTFSIKNDQVIFAKKSNARKR